MLYQYSLELKAYEKLLLGAFLNKIKIIFEKTNVVKKVTLSNQTVKQTKKTVLSSPHVNKKAREQFEMRVYSKVLKYTPKNSTENNTLLIFHKTLNQKSFNLNPILKVTSLS